MIYRASSLCIFSAVVRPVDRRDLPGLSPASDCIETWVVLLRRPQASMINAIPPNIHHPLDGFRWCLILGGRDHVKIELCFNCCDDAQGFSSLMFQKFSKDALKPWSNTIQTPAVICWAERFSDFSLHAALVVSPKFWSFSCAEWTREATLDAVRFNANGCVWKCGISPKFPI